MTPIREGATPQFDEPTYERVHNFMRGWDQGEVISASIIDRERQATLTYTDLCALLDAYEGGSAAPAAHNQLAAEVEPWLRECGSCDAGLPMACTCPKGDYRNILLKVWHAYQFGEGATPAIDREAVLQVVAEYIDDLDAVPPMGTPAEHLERRAVHVTDAVIAHLGGAS